MANTLFVVDKPIGMSSNHFLGRIKHKYKQKKAGFSGTLDPFASGCLIVAFDQYTRLFQFLQKTPKTYRATLWLGATSESLDNENMIDIQYPVDKIDIENLEIFLKSLITKIEYYPPKYSAKKIDGNRAYNLARNGQEVSMKKSIMEVYDIRLLNYSHPFITIEVSVSEGAYIRSLAQIIFEKMQCNGTLSALRRLNEGKFFINNERKLDPINFLNLEQNHYIGSQEWVSFGKKIDIKYLSNHNDGIYLILFDTFFSIISIENQEVKYLLNNIQREIVAND